MFRLSNMLRCCAHLSPQCLFCKIVTGKVPSIKLMENDKAVAFMDIGPISLGHCLVIPKYHAVKLHELPEEYMAAIGPMLVRLGRAVQTDDYNILQNNGALAHQAVHHVHFHVIPKPDHQQGLGVRWPVQNLTEKELETEAARIRAILDSR
eukprot:PhM_4_TR4913/c0_g1_i1/m.97551